MANFEIYHNPRCRKSRETLQLLEDSGKQPYIRLYLEQAPSAEELKSILQKLGMSAESLLRKGEKIYKEQFKGKNLSESEWIQVMAENPILIERPIVILGDNAVLGRPPENVKELF